MDTFIVNFIKEYLPPSKSVKIIPEYKSLNMRENADTILCFYSLQGIEKLNTATISELSCSDETMIKVHLTILSQKLAIQGEFKSFIDSQLIIPINLSKSLIADALIKDYSWNALHSRFEIKAEILLKAMLEV